MRATFVADVSAKFTGTAILFRLNPPLEGSEFVVASAVTTSLGPETYLFACDSTGKVKNWMELPGSSEGFLDCERAIKNAGYEIG